MDSEYLKIYSSGCNAPLMVKSGHFATNHSHINFYVDMVALKTRANEAREVAKSLAESFLYDTSVDTIVCLEGTEIIGAFLGEELTKADVMSMNANKTICIIVSEYINNQMIFRDNLQPLILNKNVLLLAASVTTGLSLNKGMEAIQYYGGNLQGIAAIFSLIREINDIEVVSVFGKEDLPDYASYDYRSCPYCQQGMKIDALVNAFGYSKL